MTSSTTKQLRSGVKMYYISHLHINNQDRKWCMSALEFSSALENPASIQTKKQKKAKENTAPNIEFLPQDLPSPS